MYFLRTRFYDPGDGRFLTPDSVDPDPRYPQTWNPYLYAAANPVRFTDPMGTQTLGDILVALSIASILTSIALPHFPKPLLMVATALGLPQHISFAPNGFSVLLEGSTGAAEAGIIGVRCLGIVTGPYRGRLIRRIRAGRWRPVGYPCGPRLTCVCGTELGDRRDTGAVYGD